MAVQRFYKDAYIYLAAGVVIVFLGFSQSYFFRLADTAFPYHLHGISASIWILLLVVQPWLYQRGKLKLHRKLGWASVPLIVLIVVGGMIMMRLMIQNQANYPPNTVYTLAFIDALTLLGLGALFTLAMVYRKRVRLHSRFMVSTLFGPLIPAITRVFFVLGMAGSFSVSLTYSYLVVEIVLFVLLIKERADPAVKVTYLPVFAYVVVQHIAMYFVDQWGWWKTVMDAFANNAI